MAADDDTKRNLLIAVGVIVVLGLAWVLLSKKKKHNKHNIRDNKKVKESFVDETTRQNNDSVFTLSNYNENTDNIVENFPQNNVMNVLYSDPNGNLGSTSDLGLQNLTVNGDSIFAGGSVALSAGDLGGPSAQTRINSQGIIFGGANKGRESNSAQISAGRHDADALCIVGMSKPDGSNRRIHTWAEGGTIHEGPMTVNGRLVVGGDLGWTRGLSVINGVKDWTAQIANSAGGVNVYMAHGDRYGMHINANNKDMDTYALQCYGGDKHLMTLDGKANLNVAGAIGASAISASKISASTMTADTMTVGGALTVSNRNVLSEIDKPRKVLISVQTGNYCGPVITRDGKYFGSNKWVCKVVSASNNSFPFIGIRNGKWYIRSSNWNSWNNVCTLEFADISLYTVLSNITTEKDPFSGNNDIIKNDGEVNGADASYIVFDINGDPSPPLNVFAMNLQPY